MVANILAEWLGADAPRIVWRPQHELAKDIGATRRGVQKALEWLEAKGFLTVHERGGGRRKDGKGKATRYVLTFPKPVKCQNGVARSDG